jgi:hypothetical protein
VLPSHLARVRALARAERAQMARGPQTMLRGRRRSGRAVQERRAGEPWRSGTAPSGLGAGKVWLANPPFALGEVGVESAKPVGQV